MAPGSRRRRDTTARFLVSASGVLTVPKLPEIDGVDSFAGVTVHTARWDHTLDLTDKRVAIIGTGASGGPGDSRKSPRRSNSSPCFSAPRSGASRSSTCRSRRSHARALRLPGGRTLHRLISQAYVEFTFPLAAQYFTINPFAKRAGGAGRAYLRQQVRDPEVRDKLTPRYAVGSLSDPGSTTPIWPHSTGTTSGWSPNRSTRSRVPVSRPATVRAMTSTC